MAIYITKNAVKEINTKKGSLLGISILQGMRVQAEMDKEFKERWEELREQDKIENAKDRFEQSIRRTRQNIQEVLEANLDNNSYFLTLTFAENMQDYDKANNRFNYWVRVKNNGVKYLVVKELQQRGAIHYHMIVFDCDNIKELANSWSYGYHYYKKINDGYSWSISKYFTNYLTDKNQLVHKNKKIFSTSRELKKPFIITDEAMSEIFGLVGYNIDTLEYNWLQHDYIIEEKNNKRYAVGLVKNCNVYQKAVEWFGEEFVEFNG